MPAGVPRIWAHDGVLAVDVESLTRTFPRPGLPDRVALDSVDLALPAGRTHGLLGPNGAGKTTFCKILSTVLLPSAGRVRLFGIDAVRDPREIRSHIGIAFGGERGLYGRLTVAQNLEYWATLYGLPRRRARERVAHALEAFGLTGRRGERVEVLSRGWKQRIHLARATLHEPALLLLDEPTAGLDPVAARAVQELISEQLPPTSTVIICTHDLREAERLCDEVTVIGDGRVLATGSPRLLARGSQAPRVITLTEVSASARHAMQELDVEITRNSQGEVEVRCPSEDELGRTITTLLEHGHSVFSVQSASLEGFYLELLGSRGIGE